MKATAADFMSYGIALFCAVVVHAVVIGVMSINWDDATISHTDVRPYYIEAAIVAENPYTAAEQRAEDREKQRLASKLEQRRRIEADLQREQQAWEKSRREAAARPPEPVAAVEVPELPAPTETAPTRDTEQAREEFAESLLQALQREENARKAVTDDEKAMAYVSQIQREIIQNWSRPPSARNGMETLLRVRLIPTGEVVDVNVEDSSGNNAFDRSAVLAVRKARRFVVPTDVRLFERNFREFTVLFRPDDLRL